MKVGERMQRRIRQLRAALNGANDFAEWALGLRGKAPGLMPL